MSLSLAQVRADPYAQRLALLGETTITDPVTNVTTTPVVDLEGLQQLIAQCVFVYGSGGTAADFFLQTSFDGGTTWQDVAAFRFPGVTGRSATDLDGSSDYYSRGSDLIGNADGKLGIMSFWALIDGGDGTEQMFLSNDANRIYLRRNGSNKLQLVGYTDAAVLKLHVQSTSNLLASASWVHVATSWDTAGSSHLYVDDVDVKNELTLDDAELDYTGTGFKVGVNYQNNFPFNGALAEVYFALEYLDLSDEDNRRLFISAAGHPVPLGADGSTPTGTQPIIYSIDGDMTSNLGSGGNFTAVGSPTSIAGPNVEDTRFQAIKSAIAVAANQSNSDGALDTNTILDGVLGDRLRVKYSTTGTFAGSTTIKIDAMARG